MSSCVASLDIAVAICKGPHAAARLPHIPTLSCGDDVLDLGFADYTIQMIADYTKHAADTSLRNTLADNAATPARLYIGKAVYIRTSSGAISGLLGIKLGLQSAKWALTGRR